MRFSNILAILFTTLALSTAGFCQIVNQSIQDSFQVGYASNLHIGDSGFSLSNSGASTVNGAPGNLCANIYVFDPDEQMDSCCSCLVTPDGLETSSVQKNLTNNTLTGLAPQNVVIKLVATTSSGAPCDPTSLTASELAPGLLVWGNTLTPQTLGCATELATPYYLIPAPPPVTTYVTLPVHYTDSALSAAELTSLTRACSSIVTGGKGKGICGGCAIAPK